MKDTHKMMKAFALITALVIVFALAGCGAKKAEEPEEQQDGVANPWTDVETAEEAGEGARVGAFVPDGMELSLGKVELQTYRYMDGLAEGEGGVAAVEMTVRKGRNDLEGLVAEGDISGDYNEYKYSWTRKIGDIEAQCFGNRKDEATKTIWISGDYCYSVLAIGAGGDDDFGLSKKDVKIMVSSVK